MAFTNAYVQSPVSSSRATFSITGRYPSTHHVHRNGNECFPDSEVLVTKLFANQGYDCGLSVKLHLSRGSVLERRPKDDGYRYYKWSSHHSPPLSEGHDYADWLKKKGVDPIE